MRIDCFKAIFRLIRVCIITPYMHLLTKPNLPISEVFKQDKILELPFLLDANSAKRKPFQGLAIHMKNLITQ